MAWSLVALGTQTDTTVSGGNLTLDEPTGTAQGVITLAAIGNSSLTGFTTTAANELLVAMVSHGDNSATSAMDAVIINARQRPIIYTMLLLGEAPKWQ